MPWVRRRNPNYSAVVDFSHRLRRRVRVPARIGVLVIVALTAGWVLAKAADRISHIPAPIAAQ